MSYWATTKHDKAYAKVLVELRRRDAQLQSVLIETRHTAGAARTAAKNAKIAGIQRAQGRNPFFLTAKERKTIQKAIQDGFKAFIDGRKKDFIGPAEKIGAMMIAIYREHVDRRQGARGQLKKIGHKYSIRKAKQGRTKILINTGELMRALESRITRV